MRISDWSSDVCSSDLHVRAAAAVALGRFIHRRYQEDHFRAGSSRPEQWFHLARELNSVIGAWALVNLRLREYNLRIEFDLNVDPLPRLVYINERSSRATPQANSERSEEHTSELQSLMRISYAVFCLKKKNKHKTR